MAVERILDHLETIEFRDHLPTRPSRNLRRFSRPQLFSFIHWGIPLVFLRGMPLWENTGRRFRVRMSGTTTRFYAGSVPVVWPYKGYFAHAEIINKWCGECVFSRKRPQNTISCGIHGRCSAENMCKWCEKREFQCENYSAVVPIPAPLASEYAHK